MGNVKVDYLITLTLIRFGKHQTGEGWWFTIPGSCKDEFLLANVHITKRIVKP